MATTTSSRGRPLVGPVKQFRFAQDFLEWAQEYADEHCEGNLNQALRELGDIARERVEKRRRRERRQQAQPAA